MYIDNLYLLLLIAVLSIILHALLPTIKGYVGEKIIAKKLSSLPEEEYKIINDVMLKNGDGTTQIDHVVVSVYGIFIIETKNYKGWIIGNEYDQQWVKNVYGKKYKFRNPLLQNYAHLKALMNLLDLTEDKFIPIVVFSNSSELKVKSKQPVIYTSQLKKKILTYKDIVFEKEDLHSLVTAIKDSHIEDKQVRKEHVKQIKEKVKSNEKLIEEGICPKCGGKLIERKGKYGMFKGCSNYPKCRYIHK